MERLAKHVIPQVDTTLVCKAYRGHRGAAKMKIELDLTQKLLKDLPISNKGFLYKNRFYVSTLSG